MAEQQNSEIVNIYLDWISQPCRAVAALCKIAKIQHNVTEMRIFKGELYTEEFKKINPDQKVPALVDGKFSLFESHSILRYLCDSRNVPDHLYPKKNIQKRAHIDAYLDWHHINIRLPSATIIKGTMAGKTDEVKNFTPKLHLGLKFFENFWLKNSDFIGGNDQITIADLSAYCEIITLLMIDFKLDAYPKIVAWLERVGQVEAVAESHQIFFKILNKSKRNNL